VTSVSSQQGKKGKLNMFGLKANLKKKIDEAAEVTARAARIEAAIHDEVQKLPALIDARLTAEQAFRSIECAAAIGEPAAGMGPARKSSLEAKAALDEAALRLAGFRRARGDLGTALVGAYEGIQAELPDHENEIINEFARNEWLPAVKAFSLVLGRRAAIEKFLGGDVIELAAPAPAAVTTDQLGPIGQPYDHLQQLSSAIDRIRQMGTAADAPNNARRYALPGAVSHFDPAAVYVLTDIKGFLNFPQGTNFIDASLDRGWAEYLVLSGSAKAVQDIEADGVTIAARKLATLAREIQDREQDADAQRYSAKGVAPRTRQPNLDAKQ
jgi:hypothetical protein